MTLETNERRRRRRRRLSFVRAGTHGIQPSTRVSLSSPPAITGRGTEKYRRRIFVSVSQTLLLNGSRDAFGESCLEQLVTTHSDAEEFLRIRGDEKILILEARHFASCYLRFLWKLEIMVAIKTTTRKCFFLHFDSAI